MLTMKRIEKYVDRVAFVFGLVGFVGLVIMIALIGVDVFLRKVFNSPISGSYEIVQYMLMAMVFSSFAYTQSKKGHIRVTMIIGHLPWRLHAAVTALTELLGAGAIFALAYAASLQARYVNTEGVVSDVLRFPVTPFFWIESVAMVIFGLVLLFDFACNIVGTINREYAEKLFKDYV